MSASPLPLHCLSIVSKLSILFYFFILAFVTTALMIVRLYPPSFVLLCLKPHRSRNSRVPRPCCRAVDSARFSRVVLTPK